MNKPGLAPGIQLEDLWTRICLTALQCILLATRPLLLHLLIALLKGTLSSHDSEKTLRPQTKDLLETCLQSARMILKILLTLYEHHLLGQLPSPEAIERLSNVNRFIPAF